MVRFFRELFASNSSSDTSSSKDPSSPPSYSSDQNTPSTSSDLNSSNSNSSNIPNSSNSNSSNDPRSGSFSSPDSYIIPYTMIGGVGGAALWYLTNSPIFALGLPLGTSLGMIRDRNIRTKSNGVMNSMIKATGIYKLGVPLLIIGCGFVIAIWVKVSVKSMKRS